MVPWWKYRVFKALVTALEEMNGISYLCTHDQGLHDIVEKPQSSTISWADATTALSS
jgi:hypothetical protein